MSKKQFWMVAFLVPLMVAGHGLMFQVSTPMNPPKSFGWFLPLSLFVLISGNTYILNKVLHRSRKESLVRSFFSLIAFLAIFFLLGLFGNSYSFYPVGFFSMGHAIWGRGWNVAGLDFIIWNSVGFISLFLAVLLSGGVRRGLGAFKKVLFSVLLIYVFCLIPFLFSGALSHGWAGAYVGKECDRKIKVLNSALITDALAHAGRLPYAEDFDSLLSQIEQHIPAEDLQYIQNLDLCPVGLAFDRTPMPYEWDNTYSGFLLSQLKWEQIIEGHTPIRCPYHENQRSQEFFFLEILHDF